MKKVLRPSGFLSADNTNKTLTNRATLQLKHRVQALASVKNEIFNTPVLPCFEPIAITTPGEEQN